MQALMRVSAGLFGVEIWVSVRALSARVIANTGYSLEHMLIVDTAVFASKFTP